MTPVAYRLTAVLFGVLFLGLNVSMKRELSFQELDQASQEIKQPRLWNGKVAPEVEVPLRDGTTFRLSAWGVPVQSGFLFVALDSFFRSAILLGYLSFLTVVLHPVVAVLLVLVFNESTFGLVFMMEAAVHATG